MTRRVLILSSVVTVACGPGQPMSTTETGGTAGTSTSSGATVGDESTQGGETAASTTSGGGTESAPTTSGESTESATTDVFDPGPNLEYCPLEGLATSNISGTTPFGAFTAAYARFGWVGCAGYADVPEIVLMGDEQALVDAIAQEYSYYDGGARPFPALRIPLGFMGGAWQKTGWTGETTQFVQFYSTPEFTEDGGHSATITITMSTSVAATNDPSEIPRLVGSVTIEGGGWDLAGDFDAAYCGALSWGHECA
ncbi:hypothetical protein [Nannocystis radixulma]|uniref:Uncharacterized protein n=1 Tax=Nannocystis radixulma TaxID=2995305 RepID=A0ABT5AX62_9BACT|nr:hypothetical protein [Nannocystis radixulma]MDC0666433.1 hypothetical protein [Nannocystis radixulma]